MNRESNRKKFIHEERKKFMSENERKCKSEIIGSKEEQQKMYDMLIDLINNSSAKLSERLEMIVRLNELLNSLLKK